MRFVDLIEKKETEAATDKGRASFFHYRLCPGRYSGLSGQCAANGDLL